MSTAVASESPRSAYATAEGAEPRRARRRPALLRRHRPGRRVPLWSTGRIALLGDSAYGPGPVGGGGTGLALIGAHLMAGELSVRDDSTDGIAAAFARYEELLRPVVVQAQKTPPLRLPNPATARGIRLLHTLARAAASPAGTKLQELLDRADVTPAIAWFTLPDYPPTPVPSSAP